MPDEIGPFLKKLRVARGLSVRQAAEQAGVSNAYLSLIETGKRGAPSPNILRRLAAAYVVPVGDLLEAAGYLDEPETNETEEQKVERAFAFVMADKRFAAGTRVKDGLTPEAKKYIVETYERVTGAKLLRLQ